jgi:hypothetical protein
MPEPAAGTGSPARPEARGPRKHAKPNSLPSRIGVAVGAVAALSVIAAGIGRMPGAATDGSTATAASVLPISSPTTAGSVRATRVERPVRYVHLRPGQKAPPGARVVHSAAPAPRVVVRWVTPTASSPVSRAPVSRAPVARTRQSGA